MERVGLLFDCDGVILYSEHVHEKAWYDLAASVGRELPENFMQNAIGKTDFNLAIKLSADWKNVSPEEIVSMKRAAYLKRAPHECTLIPGIKEFLEEASRLYPMALGTNSSIKDIEGDIKKFGLGKYFKTILTKESVAKPKPDPEIFIKGAEKLGVDIKKSFVFEDSIPGATAARGSGAKYIAITTSYTQKDLAPFLASFPNFLEKDKILQIISDSSH
jgi:HAD superfamily hydrolase (TIGR01509 family)